MIHNSLVLNYLIIYGSVSWSKRQLKTAARLLESPGESVCCRRDNDKIHHDTGSFGPEGAHRYRMKLDLKSNLAERRR